MPWGETRGHNSESCTKFSRRSHLKHPNNLSSLDLYSGGLREVKGSLESPLVSKGKF